MTEKFCRLGGPCELLRTMSLPCGSAIGAKRYNRVRRNDGRLHLLPFAAGQGLGREGQMSACWKNGRKKMTLPCASVMKWSTARST